MVVCWISILSRRACDTTTVAAGLVGTPLYHMVLRQQEICHHYQPPLDAAKRYPSAQVSSDSQDLAECSALSLRLHKHRNQSEI